MSVCAISAPPPSDCSMEEVDSYFETVEDSEYDAGSEMSDEYTESDN